MTKRPTFEQMKRFARPMVEAGKDYQRVQWEVLNEFDGLTNSEEDGEYIMDAIRECEDELEDGAVGKRRI